MVIFKSDNIHLNCNYNKKIIIIIKKNLRRHSLKALDTDNKPNCSILTHPTKIYIQKHDGLFQNGFHITVKRLNNI